MPIQQTKKQSDLEKRLQLLRRQVYGKSDRSDEIRLNQKISNPESSDTLMHRYTDTPISSGTPTHRSTDLAYLNQDLLKIAIFSSVAIGVQVVLFFLLKNHILNFNFF